MALFSGIFATKRRMVVAIFVVVAVVVIFAVLLASKSNRGTPLKISTGTPGSHTSNNSSKAENNGAQPIAAASDTGSAAQDLSQNLAAFWNLTPDQFASGVDTSDDEIIFSNDNLTGVGDINIKRPTGLDNPLKMLADLPGGITQIGGTAGYTIDGHPTYIGFSNTYGLIMAVQQDNNTLLYISVGDTSDYGTDQDKQILQTAYNYGKNIPVSDTGILPD